MKSPSDKTDKDVFAPRYSKILCIDFDGVIHQYSDGWKGVDNIYDPPVVGSIGWIIRMVIDERFEVAIYSARSKHEEGITAMKAWLRKWELPAATLDKISFPTQKPPAWITIDDRCFQFRGQCPNVEYLLKDQAWMTKPEGEVRNDVEFLLELAESYRKTFPDLQSQLVRIAADIGGIRE